MLLSYLTLAYLLSGLGFLTYRFLVRDKSNPRQRKQFLYALLAVSLVLPMVLVSQLPTFQFEDQVKRLVPTSHSHKEAKTKALETCYKEALGEADICECEELQKNNLLTYQSNIPYDILLIFKKGLFWLFVAAFVGILTLLVARVIYLHGLTRGIGCENRIIEGKSYHILRKDTRFAAASFRLHKRYILWHSSLDKLSAQEQKAVLMHEVAHIQNRDTWQHIGLSFLQLFWFLNPIFYLVRKELHLLNEYLADAFAIAHTGNSQAYAHLLIKLKEQQQSHQYLQQYSASSLKKRILQIVKPVEAKPRYFIPVFTCFLIAMCGISLMASPFINEQNNALEKYELLQAEHERTGKNYFCKTCLYEQLGEECLLD